MCLRQEIVEDIDELRHENKNDLIQVQQLMSTLSPHSCVHNPQCILRLPFPSPDAPLTLDQFNLSQPSNSTEGHHLGLQQHGRGHQQRQQQG